MNTELLQNLIALLIVICITHVILVLLDMLYHKIFKKWTFSRYLNDNSTVYFKKEDNNGTK